MLRTGHFNLANTVIIYEKKQDGSHFLVTFKLARKVRTVGLSDNSVFKKSVVENKGVTTTKSQKMAIVGQPPVPCFLNNG